MAEISAAEWGYIAGFIEGDGSIGIARSFYNKAFHFRVYVSAHNTERCILDWLDSLFGGGVDAYKCRANKDRFAGRKQVYAWGMNVPQIREALPYLIPWLKGVKKQRAELALQLLEVQKKSHRGYYDYEAQAAIYDTYARIG